MTVKNLPTILLLLATILSSIAISLPLWSKTKKELGGSMFSGLWSECKLTTATNSPEQVCCVNFEKKMDPPPKSILVSQILSIVGVGFAAIAAFSFVRGNKKFSVLCALISLLCMISTLIVYPVVSLKDINKNCAKDNCSYLDLSYGLQAGATSLVLFSVILLLKK